MRRIAILAAVLSTSLLVACGSDRGTGIKPIPRPPAGQQSPDPCGDGTKLGPNEHCR